MGTVLTYQNDEDRRFCEIALADGDRVQLHLGKNGLVIERMQAREKPPVMLFEGDPDTVTSMCVALLGHQSATDKSALDILVSVVSQLPSAMHVRDAFHTAAAAL